MADKNQIKNAIVLEGEAEYKKSLDSINRALRESKSAMKAAAAEYGGAEDGMVAMYRAGDALERHLENQRTALRLMTEQLSKVESAYGKNSREAVELRTKINNLRAEMSKTVQETRQFETRMEQAANAMDNVDAGQAGDAIAQLGKDAEDADGKAGGLLKTLTELTGLDLDKLGLAGAAAAAAAGVKEGIETADEQTAVRGQMAAYTGKTGEELAVLEEAGKDVYRQGYGDDLMDAAQGVATLHSFTGAMGDELQEATQYAFRMRDVFGHDIPETARTAQQMMAVFGVSASEAYGLMAAGAQQGADKKGNLLDTLNEYAPYYEKAGKSAEAFIGTLTAGAESGIYDVDKIGDAMKEFTIRLTDGSDTTKDALKTLGVEAMDLPSKFAQGGEGASAAFDMVIDKLLGIEDPLKRNQAGVALFGTQWEDTGGAILGIFDEIDSGTTDARAALDSLDATRLDDLGEGVERVARHVETAAGELFTPVSTGLAHVAHDVADKLDEMEARADEAEKVAEEKAAAMTDATADMYAQLEELDEQINDAWMRGDGYEALTLENQKQKLIDEIAQTKQQVLAGYEDIGTQAAATMEGKAGDMEAAAQTVGEGAVMGYESGAADMEGAAEDTVNGAVAVLYEGVDEAYDAGYATGKAYERGVRNALDTHSPSRVMEDVAHDTTAGLFQGFESDRERLWEAGNALREAVTGGYGSAGAGSRGVIVGPAGASGVGKGEIAAAMREALTGLAWETDVGTFARLVEPGVSAATSQRAQATVRGQSAMNKRW